MKITGFFSKIIYVVLSVLTSISIITSPVALITDKTFITSSETKVMFEALVSGQGITNDGNYVYTSGAIAALSLTSLAKYNFDDMSLVKCNVGALPFFLLSEGFDHIGGIGCYNGKIYAPAEGGEKDYKACVLVYDCETLNFTGEYYYMPIDKFYDGIPWCAVDKETGLLYASEWKNADYVYIFDVNNKMQEVGSLKVSGVVDELNRIQGAEISDGKLYLSQDTKSSTKIVYSMDIKNGVTEVAFERPFSEDRIESEDITIFEENDNKVFCTLDYNKIASVTFHKYILK